MRRQLREAPATAQQRRQLPLMVRRAAREQAAPRSLHALCRCGRNEVFRRPIAAARPSAAEERRRRGQRPEAQLPNSHLSGWSRPLLDELRSRWEGRRLLALSQHTLLQSVRNLWQIHTCRQSAAKITCAQSTV